MKYTPASLSFRQLSQLLIYGVLFFLLFTGFFLLSQVSSSREGESLGFLSFLFEIIFQIGNLMAQNLPRLSTPLLAGGAGIFLLFGIRAFAARGGADGVAATRR